MKARELSCRLPALNDDSDPRQCRTRSVVDAAQFLPCGTGERYDDEVEEEQMPRELVGFAWVHVEIQTRILDSPLLTHPSWWI